jgi:hypothetical protein
MGSGERWLANRGPELERADLNSTLAAAREETRSLGSRQVSGLHLSKSPNGCELAFGRRSGVHARGRTRGKCNCMPHKQLMQARY